MFMFCWNDAMHYHQIIVDCSCCAFILATAQRIYYLHKNTIMSAIKLIELYYRLHRRKYKEYFSSLYYTLYINEKPISIS